MSDMAGLLDNIKRAALQAVDSTNPAGLYFGTVDSTSPLTVTIDQKLTLGEKQLILSTLVQDFDVDLTMSHSTGSYTHTHSISDTYTGGGSASSDTHSHTYSGTKGFTVHLGLKLGEKVMLLRMQGGQRFLILDRVR